jgi:hypothetical protein
MRFFRRIVTEPRCGRFTASSAGAILLAVSMAAAFGATADDTQTLGEVRLALTKLPDPPPAEQRPRVAVFLIDCSSSMRDGINGPNPGRNNPQRWSEVRNGLTDVLKQLLAKSPGIEVRLRFFGTFLDCLGQGQVTAKLTEPSDIDVLMAKVPLEVPNKTECATTALYESTVKCVEQLRQENRQRNFEWWILGVFSDGRNMPDDDRRPKASTTLREQSDQLNAMVAEGAAKPVVWTVGPEAAKAAKENVYGPSEVKKIGEDFPLPPQKTAYYRLELAKQQNPGIQIDHAAKAGRHKLLVSIAGDIPAGTDVVVKPQLGAASPFRILANEVAVRPGSPAAIELELAQDVDRAKGASANFIFCAAPGKSDAPISIEGEPQVAFAFPADRTLPPDQWNLVHEDAERKGVKTLFAATPGQCTAPQWTFKGPNGVVERETGLVVSHAFSTAGTWNCEFSCTSESGDKPTKQAAPIEIVDADFSLKPPQASIGFDETASFTIVPAAGATSAVTYTCYLDGEQISTDSDGKTITLPPGNIGQIGRHTLAVIARSRLGEFDWRSEAAISVKASPRISIMPTNFVEGQDSVPITIQAAGDIGEAVVVLVNDKVVHEKLDVIYPSADQFTQLDTKIPVADLVQAALDIVVRPRKKDACLEARATVIGRPAALHAEMASPRSGEKLSARGGRRIVLKPAGDNVDDVGDINFQVALAPPNEAPQENNLIANEANRWTVAMPRQKQLGKMDVYARPVGGNLRPELFGEKPWKNLGEIEVEPAADWIPFLLWTLAILALLYTLYTALSGNEASRSRLEISVEEPVGQGNAQFVRSIDIQRSATCGDDRLSAHEKPTDYPGWSLWNWLPRLPEDWIRPFTLPDKVASVYMWQLAQAVGEDWLYDKVAHNPNWQIEIAYPAMLSKLPHQSVNGQPWLNYRTANSFDDNVTGFSYSSTYKLTPQPEVDKSQAVWVRVRQPIHRQREHWVLIILALASLAALILLAKHFHCFPL